MKHQKIDATAEVRDADEAQDYAIPEGSESEDDLGSIDPSLLGKAVVTGTDWTAATILDQLNRGNIALDPAFQRRDAWTPGRKSRFIESIILGLPIPQLVLAESQDSRGKFIVIDGKQRLLSLQQFAGLNLAKDKDPLILKGLLVRKELNGKSYANFQNEGELRGLLADFENQPIRTVVVRSWQNEKVLYVIFHRLNTSSVPLSPQELRQALHPGEFLKFASEYSEQSKGLKKMLNLTKPDFRMRDVELLIRYYANKNFIGTYAGNLKDFLDRTCRDLNKEWKQRKDMIGGQAEQFERAISATFKIFGKDSAFRKWDGTRFERRFNRAAFDIMVYYFSEPAIRRESLARRDEVKAAFRKLCSENSRFLRSLETTTKSLKSTSRRFTGWGRALKSLGIRVHIPKLKRGAGRG